MTHQERIEQRLAAIIPALNQQQTGLHWARCSHGNTIDGVSKVLRDLRQYEIVSYCFVSVFVVDEHDYWLRFYPNQGKFEFIKIKQPNLDLVVSEILSALPNQGVYPFARVIESTLEPLREKRRNLGYPQGMAESLWPVVFATTERLGK